MGAESISVTPASIALSASCAGAGSPEYFTVKNEGSADADYEIQVPEGSAFALRADDDASVGKLTGKLPAGGVVIVYVRATPTKAGTFSGQVIVKVGDHTRQVPVQVTVEGGSLALTPSLLDFGEVRQNTASQPQTIEIENSGTQAVNVLGFEPSSGVPGPFQVDLGAGSLNIGPGQKATVTATFYPEAAGPQVSAELVPTTQVPTCGEVPKLTLRGTSVNQDVTVNPVSLDFGDVDCVSPGGASKTITVSNYATTPATFTVSAPPTSWFSVAASDMTVAPATGNAPATQTITVTLKPVGTDIGSHAEPIEIDVTGAIAKKTTVTANVKSVGGIIEVVPKMLDNFRPDQATRSFGVRNVGNKYVYVRHVSSNPDAFAVSSSTNQNALSTGIPIFVSVDVNFVAQANGSHQADITTEKTNPPFPIPAGGNVCRAEVVKVSGMR